MKSSIPVIIITVFLFVTFFLYNKQMGSIPLLLLSFYLFYLGWKRVSHLKNKK